MSALVVVAAALVVLLLLALLVDRDATDDSVFTATLARGAAPPEEQPASLTAARWLVVNASTTGGLHFRARPVLTELTDARLRAGHGIDLAHPRAAALVGEPLWSIVRPDAPTPDDRMARGLTPGAMRAALDRLEAL